MKKGKIIIGITGGIATGKTLVAAFLEENGAEIIDADIISREILLPPSFILPQIVKEWGSEILEPTGQLNRKKLADIVFKDRRELEKLNKLTHPEIIKIIKSRILASKNSVVVLVVPLLYEIGIDSLCDVVWVVYTSLETQILRLCKRDNMTREEAIMRISTQMPLEEKLKRADLVIDNNETIEKTKKLVEQQIRKLEVSI